MEASFIESAVITECLNKYPDAVSEVEAVDLAAQQVWKDLKITLKTGVKDFNYLSSKYAYLNELRKRLIQNRIMQLSEFIVKN